VIRNLYPGEFGMEGKIDFPLFGLESDVMIGKGVRLEYAEKCAGYLQNLPKQVIEKLCEGAINYCEEFRVYFDDEGLSIPENMQSREILKYIHPNSLIVDTPEDDSIIAFQMELNCDWEVEHGMEWVIRDSEVLYVGPFNGESAWYEKEHFKTGFGQSYVAIDD